MAHVEQRNVPSLSPELWAEVFERLEQRPVNIQNWDEDEDFTYQKRSASHQAGVQAFQRGSRKPSKPCTASIPLSSVCCQIAIMWLQHSKSSLRTFQSASEDSLVDIVLANLVSSESSLTLVDILDVSARSIPIVATFARLDTCAFRHDGEMYHDLAPLGGLPRLKHLVLQGNSMELHHLAGLSRLELISWL